MFSQQSLCSELFITNITVERVSSSVHVVVQSFHACVLVLTLTALEELFLSCLFISQVSVGVKVELTQVTKHVRADMTPELLVIVETGVI